MSEYTQGICADGAAILKDGVMMTIEEILADLRRTTQHSGEPVVDEQLAPFGYVVYDDFDETEIFSRTIPDNVNPEHQQIAAVYLKPPHPVVPEDVRDAQRFRQLEDIFAGLKVSRSKNVLEALGFHEADPYGTLAQALLSAGKENNNGF